MRTTRTPLTGVARTLRSTSTDAERRLWYRLRDRRLGGHKFRRQYPVGNYVVDFACLERRLVVELDGGQHAEVSTHEAQRTAFLLAQGFRVLRFWNDEVMDQFDAVLEVIAAEVSSQRPGPSP